jgi:hypothetical protein
VTAATLQEAAAVFPNLTLRAERQLLVFWLGIAGEIPYGYNDIHWNWDLPRSI